MLDPLGVPGTGFANFIGYIAWSIWMVGFEIWLLGHGGADIALERERVTAGG